MKCQILFSGKNKKNISKCRLLKILPRVLSVKPPGGLLYRPFLGGGPGVSLTLCCFVVYSTRRFVVCLSVCHFVLVFFSPFSIAITSLGEERANLSAFDTFVRFVLV